MLLGTRAAPSNLSAGGLQVLCSHRAHRGSMLGSARQGWAGLVLAEEHLCGVNSLL